MRKALFLLGLAAGVAALPATASAQDNNHGRRWHGDSNDNGGGNRGNRGGGNEARQQQQQNVVRQAPQQSDWVGDRNNPRMEAARQRYEQLERNNARNYGTPDQARAVVERQRAERQNDGGWQGNGGRNFNNDNRNWNGNRGGWNGNRGDDRGGWNGNRGDNRGGWNGNRDDNRNNWRDNNRGDGRYGRGVRSNWNRDWRRDNRFDWQRYRDTNRFVFHAQPYYAPYRGWSYSRFTVGSFLDQLLFGRNYWISDPWTYRLPPAEPGLEWVRYYNDVLLVDVETGEVVDAIYDFFW